MARKIGLGLAGFAVVLVVFLAYVSTREGKFRYERSGLIVAPASTIYGYVSDLKKGHLWTPYEAGAPDMKKTFGGPDGGVGQTMDFDGGMKMGVGKLEILKLVPNELVEIRLLMTKPFQADNLVTYTLRPEGAGTRFTWTMSGDGGFMNKLLSVFIDCEKMNGKMFEEGIANLKRLAE